VCSSVLIRAGYCFAGSGWAALCEGEFQSPCGGDDANFLVTSTDLQVPAVYSHWQPVAGLWQGWSSQEEGVASWSLDWQTLLSHGHVAVNEKGCSDRL
jgi:hypothetical protein